MNSLIRCLICEDQCSPSIIRTVSYSWIDNPNKKHEGKICLDCINYAPKGGMTIHEVDNRARVYLIVTKEEFDVFGIYSTIEKAREVLKIYIEENRIDLYIAEWILDTRNGYQGEIQ